MKYWYFSNALKCVKLKTKEDFMYKVIAISGKPGSGKSSLSEEVLKRDASLVYFDFGFLFRPLTYYLVYELNMSFEDIYSFITSGKVKEEVLFSYRVLNGKVEVAINGKFYENSLLNTPDMNMQTVMVGSIAFDLLNDELRKIIDDLKEKNNVLLNARRPIAVYPEADYHIFLEASFDERVYRKMLMNNESFEVTYKKLKERDLKEEESGFFEKYAFTKTIDTTYLSKDDVLDLFLKMTEGYVYLNNLTLILGSYACNKHCPYCISKNNFKFAVSDRLDNLDNVLKSLDDSNIRFKRFVLSGNGEPSLYNQKDLEKIAQCLVKYSSLYDLVRVHSSGNIFREKNKFELFNSLGVPLEFEILRVSLDSSLDMSVLGYDFNYLESDLFNKGNIKCDIALTDYLKCDGLFSFLDEYPSIKKVRFKKLLSGDNSMTPQGRWVLTHSLSDSDILRILNDLDLKKKENIYQSCDGKILYKISGDYENDYVINNGEFKNYQDEVCNIKVLKRKMG